MATAMALTLHGHAMGANPWKVAIILEELGISYKHKLWAFPDLKKEPFESLNPNGRVPALEDPNTGVNIFEVSKSRPPLLLASASCRMSHMLTKRSLGQSSTTSSTRTTKPTNFHQASTSRPRSMLCAHGATSKCPGKVRGADSLPLQAMLTLLINHRQALILDRACGSPSIIPRNSRVRASDTARKPSALWASLTGT